MNEQFKGEVDKKELKFPQELGEEHPFDFVLCEKAYRKIGLVQGVVDKFVDFIMGGGFYVTSDNPKAVEIINMFMRDNEFNTLLRSWIKEGLIKGSGFMELGGTKSSITQMKVINSNHMYIRRDKYGEVQGFAQYTGNFSQSFERSKKIEFEPWQIACLTFNKVGDDAYGNGIVSSLLRYLDNLTKSEDDMHMIQNKKANSPIIINVGTTEQPPSDADLTSIGKKLEWLNNKHEWVFGPDVKFGTVDFGQIGEKFSATLDHDLHLILAD